VESFYGENFIESYPPNRAMTADPYHLLRIADHDKIVLSVLDNGIGIADKERDKLYKLFGCL